MVPILLPTRSEIVTMQGTSLTVAGALLGGVLLGGGAAWFGRSSLEAKASPALPPPVPAVEHRIFTGPAEPLPVHVAPRPAAAPAQAPTPHRSRSTKKSAVIIAGSAGTGAAIGGIGAGGKGAAIGALSGGAAGVVYDQLTRNRR
ncbi:MAG: hypothetical protein U0Q16_38810 [Bryobacteraceae bacterium]